MQLPEESQQETAPAKAKGKAASPADASDFSQFVGQFLGTVAQNTQPSEQATVSVDTGSPCLAAQPAQQPADASTLLENAAPFLGVSASAPAPEGPGTTALPVAAPGPEDKAVLADTNSLEDSALPIAKDKTATPGDAEADQQPSDNAGDPAKQENPDLHELPAKQDPSGIVADQNNTGEPVGADQSSALLTDNDFSTVMHQASSGVQNVQTQIGGATITHATHEGNAPAPLHGANAAEVLDADTSIVKDGNRIAVKFEQDGLGRLDLDLRLNKGVINAQIQVADDSTKTIIENNMQQIVDSLLKAGLSVGGFSVSLKGGGSQYETNNGQNGYGKERAAGAAVEGAESAQRAAANGLVSIFI